MLTFASTQCVVCELCSRLHAVTIVSSSIPSIGSERKTYFPIRHRFFDPGVCSRFGYAVST